MHNIRIDIEKKTLIFQHPEKFNELTSDQYLKVCELFILSPNPLNERTDDQIKLLYTFLGGFSNEKRIRKQAYAMIGILCDDDRIHDFIKLQHFLTEEQDFNNWLIPKLTIGKEILYGPVDRFSSMKFGEFIAADMYISAYFGSKEPDAILNKIIAILYRRKRKGIYTGFIGDMREDFNSEYLETRVKLIEKMDEIHKKAILYNYVGLRNWLSKKYVAVFRSPETSSRTNISFGSKESGWLSIRRHLAGSALNLEKTDQLNLHDVLGTLNEEMLKT